MMATIFLHNVTSVTITETAPLPNVASMSRDIIVKDEDGNTFEITLFGTTEGLGLIEKHRGPHE